MNNSKRTTFIGLDLVRFSAALIVMLFHLGYLEWTARRWKHADYVTAFLPASDFFRIGWVGVEVFFVVSGFVIAFSAQGKTPREFVLGRIARLYPGVWICASISAATLAIVGQPDLTGWLGSMVISPVGPWIDGAYWTLAVELWFYAMVAITLALGGAERLPLLAWCLAGLSSGFWALRLALFAIDIHFDAYLGLWSDVLLLKFGCFFALGMALWLKSQAGKWAKSVTALAALSGIGCMVEVLVHTRSTMNEHGVNVTVWPLAVWLMAIGFVMFSVRFHNSLEKRIGKRGKILRLAGLATYPLYLLHTVVGREIMLLVKSPWMSLAIAVFVVILLAFVVTKLERFIREPLLRLATSERA